MPLSTAPRPSPLKSSGPELEELDITSLTLAADHDSLEPPLTPVSSRRSSIDLSTVGRRSSRSRSSSLSHAWSPPVSPSPTRPVRSSSSTGIIMRQDPSPSKLSPSRPLSFTGDARAFRPASLTLSQGPLTYEDDLPTPRANASSNFTSFVEAAFPFGEPVVNTAPVIKGKPIPSLIGPESLHAFSYVGTNLEPEVVTAPPPQTRIVGLPSGSPPRSASERAAQRNAQRNQAWQSNDRANEARQVREEIERTKQEMKEAIAARAAAAPPPISVTPTPINSPARSNYVKMPFIPPPGLGAQLPMQSPYGKMPLINVPGAQPGFSPGLLPPGLPLPFNATLPPYNPAAANMQALLPLMQQIQYNAVALQHLSALQQQQQQAYSSPQHSSPPSLYSSVKSTLSSGSTASSTGPPISAPPPSPVHSRAASMTSATSFYSTRSELPPRTALAAKQNNNAALANTVKATDKGKGKAPMQQRATGTYVATARPRAATTSDDKAGSSRQSSRPAGRSATGGSWRAGKTLRA